MQIDLEQLISGSLFAFLLVFLRIGSGLMVMPGIGESYVSPRTRLLLALAVALAMTPALGATLPPLPGNPWALAKLITIEIIAGVFIGLIARLLISTLHIAGMVMSFQSSLSSATMFDVTQASQGSTIGNFLSVTGVVLIFATNLHHLVFRGLFDSYAIFPPGAALPLGDLSNYMAYLVNDIFLMGIKLAAPLIVVGLMITIGMGLMSRLMPAMQVFYIIVPPQIMICLIVLMLMLSGVLLWYADFFQDRMGAFVADRNV